MDYGIPDTDSEDTKSEGYKLKRIKGNVERAIAYWKNNAKRFHHFQNFCFKSQLTSNDKSALDTAQKPTLEFNIVNSPLSRQVGEFSKQEPSIEVKKQWGVEVSPEVIEVVDGHLRHIIDEAKKRNTQYSIYRDSMSGGFSDFKVWTDYAHEMSMDQIIKLGKSYNPTMVGFDPMAREIDKSDAEFAFELFPMDKEQFKKDHPDVNVDQFSFLKFDGGVFNWCFKNQEQFVIILADYYEKVKTKKKIVRLADLKQFTPEAQKLFKQTMLKKDYEEAIERWNSTFHIEQAPQPVEERKSDFIHIRRSQIIENKILEEKDTSFRHLNLVFVDGDSVVIQDEDSASMEQFTKPYIYHAEGLQRMTNFTGQVIANDFENMVQNKWMICEESLPTQEEALEGWRTPQKADLLVWRAYSDINPDKPLPPPTNVSRIGLPPEVVTTFNSSMQMLQNILGSYDASLAQANEQNISGVAIVEAATLSNGAAMPYVVNYMQALTQVANIIVDLIPKYYKTPRTIPIIKKDGTKDYVLINQEGGVDLNYDANALHVLVEAGVNFAIAKNKALQQITMLMKVSPEFAEFMNEVGLETLLENIEFRNVDLLKEKVKDWQKKKAEEKKNKPDPEEMKAKIMEQQLEMETKLEFGKLDNEVKKTQIKGEEVAANVTLKTEQLVVEKEKQDNERLKIMQAAGESKEKMMSSIAKAEAEETRALVDLHLKVDHQEHTQVKELSETLIKHHQATKEPKHEGKKEEKAGNKKGSEKT